MYWPFLPLAAFGIKEALVIEPGDTFKIVPDITHDGSPTWALVQIPPQKKEGESSYRTAHEIAHNTDRDRLEAAIVHLTTAPGHVA